mmetsp:Transcript_17023/g.44006  ORF Transcript_17023/g.44006 Transcript_17023/m.44006 type:complete len:208 (-) Transcript_17023:147-770(-)
MTVRARPMCARMSSRICSLMSLGWPWAVSAIIVSPGRSTSDKSGTYAEWIRRWIGVELTHLPGPASATVRASISARICAISVEVGLGAVSANWRSVRHAPVSYEPNSARIELDASDGACTSWRWRGQRVTIDSPSGKRSHAMIALRRLDLPLDWVPTTTSCGSSGSLKSSDGSCCSRALSVLATRSTSAELSIASGEPSLGPRGPPT